MVFDDGSSDGTAASIRELINGVNNFHLFVHRQNQGYAKTYIELFEKCETKYLVVGTDDDLVLKGQTSRLYSFINKHDYDFVSSQFLINGKLYRGANKDRRIKPSEIFGCSNHAPGLVYKISVCREALDGLRRLVKEGSAAALVYPQVMVVSYLLLKQNCYWWPEPLMVSGANLPSGLRDSNGEQYHFVIPRWKQFVSFEEHFESLSKKCINREQEKIVRAMSIANRSGLYGHLRTAIIRQYPELAESFDKSVRQHAVRLYAKQIVRFLGKIAHSGKSRH